MERKLWIDNLRWVTVLSVVVYHVFYLFNAEGTFGGIGGFADVQYQDVLLYVLYPWFMLLLFVVAGMSSRYALEVLEAKLPDRRAAHRQFVRQRTLKLLVPSTIGLFVYHWMTGWLNMSATGGYLPEGLPAVVRYFIFALTGIGPLWFIQDLWLFSLLLVVVRWMDKRDRLLTFSGWIGSLSSITVTLVLMVLAALLKKSQAGSGARRADLHELWQQGESRWCHEGCCRPQGRRHQCRRLRLARHRPRVPHLAPQPLRNGSAAFPLIQRRIKIIQASPFRRSLYCFYH